MTAPDELDRKSELMEIGGSLRSSPALDERASRDTKISFSRRQRGNEAATEPGRVRLAVDRLDHSTRVLGVATALAVVAAGVAVTGFVVNRPTPVAADAGSPALVNLGGMSQNQAACAAYATIEGEVAQSMIERYNVGLPPDPHVYQKSVRRLDALSRTFPAADYRLIIAFGAVADHTATLLHGLPNSDQHGTVPGYTTLAAARLACMKIADYDTSTAALVTAGHPPPSAAAREAYNVFGTAGAVPDTPGLADNPDLPSSGNAVERGSTARSTPHSHNSTQTSPLRDRIPGNAHWRPHRHAEPAP